MTDPMAPDATALDPLAAVPPGRAAAALDRRASIDALDRAIVSLTGRINAATYDLLVLIRRFDERAGWLGWGFEHCADWLAWRCGLSKSAAREKVRVAHALKTLPQIGAAFANGELSYSKVRALTRVADAGNEDALLAFALNTTAPRVEERCRELRYGQPASTDETVRAHARRGLILRRDAERGVVTLTVELPLETGELVDRALDRALEASVATAPAPKAADATWTAQRADALVTLAQAYLGGSTQDGAARDGAAGSADRYQVTVHVDAAALHGGAAGSSGRGTDGQRAARGAVPPQARRKAAAFSRPVPIGAGAAGSERLAPELAGTAPVLELRPCGPYIRGRTMTFFGGDLASTWVAKPEVHAEVQVTSLNYLQIK